MFEVTDIHLETVDSTQNFAKQHLKTFDPHKITCIRADLQTEGKGRRGRAWHSPLGENLYLTYVFRLPKETSHLTALPLLMAYSLLSVLVNHHLSPQIRWPNDLLLSGKKFAGILCETSFSKNHVDIFLGLGINVNMDKEELTHIDKPATSLSEETKTLWNADLLQDELEKAFVTHLKSFLEKGFFSFQKEIDPYLAHKNHRIVVSTEKGMIEGIFDSLSPEGALYLRTPEGELTELFSGDLIGIKVRAPQ